MVDTGIDLWYNNGRKQYIWRFDFYEDIFGSYTPAQLSINNLYCSDGEINNTCESSWVIKSSGLQNNEINMSYSAFNEIFGTFYSSVNASTFEPMDMVIRRYYGALCWSNCLVFQRR